MDVTFYCQIDMPEGWYLRALIGVASGIGTPRMYQMRELYRAQHPTITEQSVLSDAELYQILEANRVVSGANGAEADDACAIEQSPFCFTVRRGSVNITLRREDKALRLTLEGPLDEVAACARGVYCLQNFDHGAFAERKLPVIWSSSVGGRVFTVEKLVSELQSSD